MIRKAAWMIESMRLFDVSRKMYMILGCLILDIMYTKYKNK